MIRSTHLPVLVTALLVGSTWFARGEAPANDFAEEDAPRDWVILGPLPNPAKGGGVRDQPRDSLGLEHDFLTALGGEGTARFAEGDAVQLRFPDGLSTNLAARAARIKDLASGIDFAALVSGPTDHRVAYAYTTLRSDKDRTAWVEFGSDDGAAVWVNGREVHRFVGQGRASVLGDDAFPIELKAGFNHLLVKVENGVGGWAFALELVGEETRQRRAERKQHLAEIQRAQGAKLVLDPEYGYCMAGNTFPAVHWDRKDLLEQLYGPVSTTVRWFDADLNEVKEAAEPGGYAAYVEAATESGTVLRRAITVFRAHPGFEYWRSDFPISWGGIPSFDIAPDTWVAHQDQAQAWASAVLGRELADDEAGAMLLTALWERDRQLKQDPSSKVPAWWRPDVVHAEYHLGLRAKVLGTETTGSLAEPLRMDTPAPILAEGSEQQAGFKPGAAEAIDAACRTWAEEAGIPFSICIARRGYIILNRGYGKVGGAPATAGSGFDIASLSKFHTGILLTQFLDQGLLEIDDPAGKYLPDLPTEGDRVMTLRMCMSHTAGTQGHGNWGGFANPWFDNVVAMGLEAYEPGTRWEYNGLSLNLAGRVMEAVAGRSFVRLMNEQLYGPLGCGEVRVFDSSFGTRIAAEDLAKVAQMLINGGAYGHHRFFRAEALEHLMPVTLGDEVPTLQGDAAKMLYGLGCNLLYDPFREDVPADAQEGERSVFGPMLNHGSATGSMMRTDLENGLIIAMSRQATGPDYGGHVERFLRAVGDALVGEN